MHVCVKPSVQLLFVKLLLRNYFYFEMNFYWSLKWKDCFISPAPKLYKAFQIQDSSKHCQDKPKETEFLIWCFSSSLG